jgi:hypothetical protein
MRPGFQKHATDLSAAPGGYSSLAGVLRGPLPGAAALPRSRICSCEFRVLRVKTGWETQRVGMRAFHPTRDTAAHHADGVGSVPDRDVPDARGAAIRRNSVGARSERAKPTGKPEVLSRRGNSAQDEAIQIENRGGECRCEVE